MENADKALEAISKRLAEMDAKMASKDDVKRMLEEEQKRDEEAAKAAANETDKKLEELARAKATRDPAMVVDKSEAIDKGRSYSFLDARRDYQKGKNSPYPYWEDDTAKGFGEFAMAVAQKDHAALKRIYSKANAPYTATTSAGGYLIPDEYRSELIRAAYVKSLALQLCRVIPMMSDTLYLPSVTTSITPVWGTINTATGDTKATFGQVTLSVNKLVAVSYVPNELMQDSLLSFAGWVAEEYADAFARRIDHEAWTGDASDAADVFEGWGRAATTNRESSGVSGDSANGSIAADHILNTIGKLSETALDGAVWIMPPTVWAQVRALADSNTDLMVGPNQPYRYNLFGFPVYLTSQMVAKASVAAGDELALFGNPKNYIIGDRRQFTIAASEHAAITADQTVFVAIQRLAMSIGLETEVAVLSRAMGNGGNGPSA